MILPLHVVYLFNYTEPILVSQHHDKKQLLFQWGMLQFNVLKRKIN